MEVQEDEAYRLSTVERWSEREIAAHLGISNGTAHTRIQAAAERLRLSTKDASSRRQAELEHLEFLSRESMKVLRTTHYVVTASGGMPRMDGQFLVDHEPTLKAITTLRQISESRRKLLGLDLPVPQRVEVITEEILDKALAELPPEVVSLAEERIRREKESG